MNLAIGTANFNKSYGISDNNIINKQDISTIFKIVKKNKINYLDTAFEYGLIKNLENQKNIKIITKIKLPKKNKKDFIENLDKIIEKELLRIHRISYEAILLHNIQDLKSNYIDHLLKKIRLLKKKKMIKKIGVSIYSPKDLDIVFSKFKPDIVQAPINVFDNRLINSKWFEILKKKKIVIQARSIFLQGLLIKKISLIKKLNIDYEIFKRIKKFESWCKNNNISRTEACLNFVKSIKGVKIITVGINNSSELREIIDIVRKSKKVKLINFSTENVKVIDPRKW